LGLDFKTQKKPSKRRRLLGLLMIILAVFIIVGVYTTLAIAKPATLSGTVARVVDGDTFKFEGLAPSIRIWGLDAPERGETGGSQATRTLKTLIAQKTLSCSIRDIDKYKRIVGQCWLPNGNDIASEMIVRGAASEYCYFSNNHYGTC